MQTDTGRIYSAEAMRQIQRDLAGNPEALKKFKRMKVPPTARQMYRTPPSVGKYDPCPCGSGLKFKWCCYTGE